MNRKRLNNIIKATMFFIAVSVGTAFSGNIDAFADSNLEKEFVSVVSKYSNDEVVVENGISLRKGETLDLSKHKGWEMSNNNVIEINENGIATPKETGTVYLSNKIGNKVHIVEVYVPSNSAFYRTSRSNSVDRNYYKVFIDPGHGGADNGASGNGLLEDELTLQISLKLKNILQSRGIEVKMSRESDVYVSLGERTNMGNAYGADVFVSPHINSFNGASAKGIETYYHLNKSSERPLSSNIQENAIKETGAVNRGVKSANFAVIRESSMPSSLFEAGFISNPEEASKLGNSEYQNKLAKALADGIEKYLKDNIKLSGSGDKPIVPETPSTPEGEAKIGIVTASSLNVRSGAGTSYSTIGSLKNGQSVQIVSTQGSWHKIKYGNGYGYVSSDYIKINSNSGNQTPPSTDTPNTSTKKGTVNATSLNVRSGAGTSYSTIGSLRNGASVEIVSTSNGWHKIKYGNGYGYVSADYVKVDSQSSQPSNPTPPSTPETPNNSIKSGTVTADSLNIRSGAGTGHSVIGSLKRGAKVQIVSTSNGWHKIKNGSGYGYVSSDYVKVDSQTTPSKPENPNKPSTPETPSTSTKKGIVTATSLNIRSGAGTGHSIIGSLRNGASVEIISTSNGWHKIKHGNRYGYISADFVKISSGSSSNSSTSLVRTGTVTAGSLNVRERATTNSLAIGAFKKGSKVKVLGTSNGWHKIEYGYGYGYVSAQYVSF
ncbi:hypothetical protein HMPREF1092_01800 [Clostridium thermobutyricum]|uniref:SH3b domain-containing protein n=1 Tax=Clostridium thermobutyricum TaxID=29372 RepID=N9WI28_9CLOT|nr:SH3 domain-containing protein [Clostridium thermobutyricum]ENZ02565.1 hypothetical protein HMPREF1092_01800 [Clostridium thermobutyricum]